jgi:hypothetical protein
MSSNTEIQHIEASFEQGELKVMLPGGEQRVFHCTELLSLAVRAWWRRLRLSYCESSNLDPDSASITLMDLLTFTLDGEDRTVEAMHLAYPGDHAGIDWYNAVTPEAVEEALAHFFLSCFARRNAKNGKSQTSLSRSAAGSQEAA